MSENTTAGDLSGMHKLLLDRSSLMSKLQALDAAIFAQLQTTANSTYQPLTQETVSRMINQNIGQLKVAELCAIADLAPATYYNVLSKVGSIKTATLQRVLNAVGLDLFVGKRLQVSPTEESE